MGYDFKAVQEIAWAAGVSAIVFALTAVTQAETVTDWRPWLTALAGGTARAAAGAALAVITRRRV
jgi:pyruvate/2-oxoacid:ferredoxin oxidoreductase beta subunit